MDQVKTDRTFLSLLDSPVYAVTAQSNGRHGAMIATWFTQLSMARGNIKVLLVVSRSNLTSELLLESKCFRVHLLSKSQVNWVPGLGGRSGRSHDKFSGVDFEESLDGPRVLLGACGWLLGGVTSQLILPDRVVVAADLLRERVAEAGHSPLMTGELSSLLGEEEAMRLRQKWDEDAVRDEALIRGAGSALPSLEI